MTALSQKNQPTDSRLMPVFAYRLAHTQQPCKCFRQLSESIRENP
jgi:hypothetical protein